MENSILDQLLLPWWKIVVYFLVVVLAAISVKVSLTFNVNTWLQDRRKAQAVKERKRTVGECGHAWTLYPDSVYSQCNLCLAYINTSTLLTAEKHFAIKPIIMGTHFRVTVAPTEGSMVVGDYSGQRK